MAIAVGCVIAYVCSAHQGIFTTQRIDVPKRARVGRRPDRRAGGR
jgi:hypothetical protein